MSSDTDNIYLIQPGQKMGLGDEPYENIAEVAEIDVQASVPSYATERRSWARSPPRASATSDESSQWKTTFTAKSTYEVQIDSPYAYVIYRNAAGDIVGGSYGFMNVLRSGGSTSGEVTSYEPIPGVDPLEDRGLRRPRLPVLGRVVAGPRVHTYEVAVAWTGNTGTGTSGYRGYARDHGCRPTARRRSPARPTPPSGATPPAGTPSSCWWCHCRSATCSGTSTWPPRPAWWSSPTATTPHGHMTEDGGAGAFTEVVLRPG